LYLQGKLEFLKKHQFFPLILVTILNLLIFLGVWTMYRELNFFNERLYNLEGYFFAPFGEPGSVTNLKKYLDFYRKSGPGESAEKKLKE
jgi:hypothetical protein